MFWLISSLAPASITHFTDYIVFTPARAEACFALRSSVTTLPSRMLSEQSTFLGSKAANHDVFHTEGCLKKK